MSRKSVELLLFFCLSLCICGNPSVADSPQGYQIPVLYPPFEQPHRNDEATYGRTKLQLRQIYHHGTRRHPGLHRKVEVKPNAPMWALDEYTGMKKAIPELWVKPQSMNIQRLADRSPARIDSLQRAGRARGAPLDLPFSDWTVDTIKGPNYTDRETVLTFARMALDAYIEQPFTGDWREVNGSFNYTNDFGWQKDGLRGHIFADEKNMTVVIALKGTSPAVFDGAETTTHDKENDNLFFGCCCGQGGAITWKTVCDCMTSTYTCNSTCLSKAVREKDLYYDAAKQLYHNVTALYPGAEIWLSGHSLGGAVASLLAMTYGVPTMTFGAPGEVLPATRLGLPIPKISYPDKDGHRAITGSIHFGHTADAIYMGTCGGGFTACSIAGYAMQSVCHTGLECTYDTVGDKGWHNNMWNHRIAVTLEAMESYPGLPKCEPVVDCVDCYSWNYFESNSSTPTTSKAPTSTSSSFSRTRTQTCKTPGWWGCLDESTTSTVSPSTTTSTSVPTTSSSTSTCKTPGWFGCLDESTSTTTTSTTTPSTTTSSSYTCHSPGWFGCLDPTTTTTTTTTTRPTRTSTSATPESTTCEFLDLFFCHPYSTSTTTATTTTVTNPTITPAPTAPTSTLTKTATSSTTTSCRHPGVLWGCWDKHRHKHKDGDGRDPEPSDDPWRVTATTDSSL